MNKRFLINWAIWIGVFSGIYCLIYVNLPLPTQSLMWMTFVGLPIYFNGGAKREEYFSYVFSMLAGIAWGLIYLYFIGIFATAGVSVPITLLVVVALVTIACVVVHLVFLGNTWLNKVPIIYGAISMTFSQNGQNLTTVIITLLGGLTLGLICQEGTKLLDEQGRWSLGKSK